MDALLIISFYAFKDFFADKQLSRSLAPCKSVGMMDPLHYCTSWPTTTNTTSYPTTEQQQQQPEYTNFYHDERQQQQQHQSSAEYNQWVMAVTTGEGISDYIEWPLNPL